MSSAREDTVGNRNKTFGRLLRMAVNGIAAYEVKNAPINSQFIPRPNAYAEIADGLRQRSPVVLIASLGGMGKTSLAREVAAQCLQDTNDAPRFDAVVWISDKDRPGTTNLSTLLDEI